VAAVRAVKRSDAYRRHRDHLQDPAPCEVWADGPACIVLFSLRRARARHDDEYLAFTVAPGERGLSEPLVLTVDATAEGWKATTSTPIEVGLA
jgi:hypothetical protein